jgi:serine kinase of HPr protein (carbohydrate metabolism regulator)
MRPPALSSETVHASCVAIDGRAVLIGGRSGRGKSDLALRLIDRGAALVSDDYSFLRRAGGRLLAAPPETIAGRIEVRGVGLVTLPFERDVPVALYVDLDARAERLPDPDETRLIAGVAIPAIGLDAFTASAPLKVEAALRLIGARAA